MFKDRNIGGYRVRFQLWDSAGQERYRAISPIHYKSNNIIIKTPILLSLCTMFVALPLIIELVSG